MGCFYCWLSDSIKVMNILIVSLLGICFGSFVNALVWRIKNERNFVNERSECTHCHHILAWNDLIPVVSWLLLRGKCRYCHKHIEDSPLLEILVMGLFVVSYVFWPFMWSTPSWLAFGLWLVSLVMLVALAVYDARWFLLPDKLVWPLVSVGILLAGVRWIGIGGLTVTDALIEIAGGICVIAGLYFVLHAYSKGKWVGFGDVKLGIFIGAILGWQQALLALFLANLIGLLAVLPGMISKKMTAQSKVPFGPFLIIACIIAFLFGERIIDWYLNSILVL